MRAIAKVACSLLMLVPTVAARADSIDVHIEAHVDVFCKISAPDGQIDLRNGRATVGTVSEICNTPSGYDVSTQFTNLDGGELNVAGQNYTIDNKGKSVRSVDEARVQTLEWRVADAQIVSRNQPVLMHVTIAPR